MCLSSRMIQCPLRSWAPSMPPASQSTTTDRLPAACEGDLRDSGARAAGWRSVGARGLNAAELTPRAACAHQRRKQPHTCLPQSQLTVALGPNSTDAIMTQATVLASGDGALLLLGELLMARSGWDAIDALHARTGNPPETHLEPEAERSPGYGQSRGRCACWPRPGTPRVPPLHFTVARAWPQI